MDSGFMIGTGLVTLGLVVWLTCAYVAAKMARQRHRSPVGWGILGLLIGPFAPMALAVMQPGPSPIGSSAATHESAATHHQTQADLYEVPHKKHH